VDEVVLVEVTDSEQDLSEHGLGELLVHAALVLENVDQFPAFDQLTHDLVVARALVGLQTLHHLGTVDFSQHVDLLLDFVQSHVGLGGHLQVNHLNRNLLLCVQHLPQPHHSERTFTQFLDNFLLF